MTSAPAGGWSKMPILSDTVRNTPPVPLIFEALELPADLRNIG